MNSDHVQNVISSRFDYAPKIQQIDAILHLLSEQKNLILIVKIEFDKSIIFQIASLMYAIYKMILIIMSLKALKAQQCKKLSDIEKCKSFVLNDDSNNHRNLNLIRQRNFTHSMIQESSMKLNHIS